ncbi:MAG: hypothetical protein HYY67_07250 [Thaumarchaeota archaeon]|nr:hypothetical protein [Nitrososphaerota archaeon]
MTSSSTPTEDAWNRFHAQLYKQWRPRVVVDIGPSKTDWPGLFDVSIRNIGGSPAFGISCVFTPDLPYPEQEKLSSLAIFQKLPMLAQGDEIRFFFESSVTYLNNPETPKRSTATISYRDSDDTSYTEKNEINLELYRGILYGDRKDIDDVVKELRNLTRILEKLERDGIYAKSWEDIQRERREHEEWVKKTKEEFAQRKQSELKKDVSSTEQG